MNPVYLDHNATTPVSERVRDAMLPWFGALWGNPSSQHAYGRAAKAALEDARAQLAHALGLTPEWVVFTSGGTEATNLAIRGIQRPGSLAMAPIEHPATRRAAEASGRPIHALAVHGTGQIDAQSVDPRAALVTVIHAHNETGVLQPVRALRDAAPDAVLHVDAAQSLGKVPVHVHALGADLLTIAGHKLYAPAGVGALCIRPGVELSPLVVGAGHERGLRPGTENVPYAVGLATAVVDAVERLDAFTAQMHSRREQLWRGLHAALPQLVRISRQDGLPNTLLVAHPSKTGATWLANAPDVAASTGSACHDGVDSPSATLVAMGLPHNLAMGAVRLSLGRMTTEAEVARAVSSLIAAG